MLNSMLIFPIQVNGGNFTRNRRGRGKHKKQRVEQTRPNVKKITYRMECRD